MPPDRRGKRQQAVLAALDELGVDGLIVSHVPNLRYLTGFTGSAAMVAVLRHQTVFLSDFRYEVQAAREVGDFARVETVSGNIWNRMWEILGSAKGAETVGFESQTVTVSTVREWQSSQGGPRLEPTRGVVEQLRACKDPEEVEAIRESSRVAGEALEATLQGVRVGQREIDVAAELERQLRMRGSEWHPFPTIVASGPRSALPHARSETREIRAGDLLLLDFGAQVDGYCADITRTVVVGQRADERQRAVYELVRDAQAHARRHIAAGMSGKEGDALARDLIVARGFGDAFGHSLGHGLGLEVHEDPRVSQLNEKPLPVGSVVTVEPGVYLPGWGGVRIEDDVHLGAERTETLSDGCTELRELT